MTPSAAQKNLLLGNSKGRLVSANEENPGNVDPRPGAHKAEAMVVESTIGPTVRTKEIQEWGRPNAERARTPGSLDRSAGMRVYLTYHTRGWANGGGTQNFTKFKETEKEKAPAEILQQGNQRGAPRLDEFDPPDRRARHMAEPAGFLMWPARVLPI